MLFGKRVQEKKFFLSFQKASCHDMDVWVVIANGEKEDDLKAYEYIEEYVFVPYPIQSKRRSTIMQRNRYLDEIGLKPEDYGTNYFKNKRKLFRQFKERKIYGFYYRETINLDRTFVKWLYSHLRMYVDYCISDLSFHTIEFEHKKYTIEKGINEIMDSCKEYLLQKEDEVTDLEINEMRRKMGKVIHLFAEIYSYLWL